MNYLNDKKIENQNAPQKSKDNNLKVDQHFETVDYDEGGKSTFFEYLTKAVEFEEEECEDCIYFIWVYCFEGSLELTLNIRERNTEVELKVNNVMSDRVNSGDYIRYLINSVAEKDTLINLRVFSGQATIKVEDNSGTIF